MFVCLDQSVSIPKPLLPEQRDEVIETLKNRLEKTLSEQQAAQQRNQELEKEKKNLQNLVKEYETSLETVTNKLRTYAVSLKLNVLLAFFLLIIFYLNRMLLRKGKYS